MVRRVEGFFFPKHGLHGASISIRDGPAGGGSTRASGARSWPCVSAGGGGVVEGSWGRAATLQELF